VIDSPYLVEPGKRIKLDKISTDDTGKFKDKPEGKNATQANLRKLDELQEVLYAQSKYSVLVVLQAMDAGGKDGTIESIFSGVNPQGCAVSSFKAPSHLELSHDYLWRVHNACPARGMIGIFNRSHYEDVLIARVKKLVPKSVWSKRYNHINEFERMLADNGTLILKFFLHITKDEQRKRLQKRLEDRTKRWKFKKGDLTERKLWKEYQRAYEDALSKTSTQWAPWHIVPANHKWYRDYVVASILVDAIERLRLKYPKTDVSGIVVK